MNYLEMKKNTDKLKNQSLFVIYGDEQYLIESMIDAIVEQQIKNGDQEDQWITFDLDEHHLQDALLEVETFPFFGDKKVVVCHNAYFLTAKKVKQSIDHDLDQLLQYLDNPVDFSTLILVVPYPKLDERKKLLKAIKKEGTLINCEAIKDYNIDQWIQHFKSTYYLSFDDSVKDLLVQEVGSNLQLLEQEIRKLSLYTGKEGQISYEDAKQLIAHSGQTSGFKLVDRVMAHDLAGAIDTYKDLSRIGEEEIGLLALLASQLRTIYQVKLLIQKGHTAGNIAKQLSVHPYVVKMSEKRAHNFSIQQLYTALDYCADADFAIKQGKLTKSLAFELLLYKLVNDRIAAK